MPWYAADSGCRLWYEDHGAGTPLVLVHGWCMSSAIWRLQQEGLAGTFRVITIDLAGHGQSEPSSDGFDLSECVRDIAGLMEYLRLDHALLAGWSLGSLIVLDAFAHVRKRLAGLILVAATPRFTKGGDFPHGLSRSEVDGMTSKVRRSISRARAGFTGRMFAAGELDEPSLALMVENILASVPLPDTDAALQALDVLVDTDLRDRLGLIDLPTLIVNGDSDVICLPLASDFLARHIRSAYRKVLAGCGHAPFLTQSRRFNVYLEEFRGMVSGRAN